MTLIQKIIILFKISYNFLRECIARVCSAAGLRSADKKRRVCQAAANALAARPRMSHSGSNVALTVSSRAITVAVLEGGETIARHDMPRVSFASGGDQVRSSIEQIYMFNIETLSSVPTVGNFMVDLGNSIIYDKIHVMVCYIILIFLYFLLYLYSNTMFSQETIFFNNYLLLDKCRK